MSRDVRAGPDRVIEAAAARDDYNTAEERIAVFDCLRTARELFAAPGGPAGKAR